MLNDRFVEAYKRLTKKEPPLWKGPSIDGITQSLLGGYLICPERFRIKVIDGLTLDEGFVHRLEYGQMWHLCEEALAAGRDWKKDLREYAKGLASKHVQQSDQVNKWYQVCKTQFPVYVRHWEDEDDVKNRIPLYQEVSFKVQHNLPSGRMVWLKGKWDSVDVIDDKLWLQENKTKGDYKEDILKHQLTFDMQTGIYITALVNHTKTRDYNGTTNRIGGVRYNVVRRPLSGGKGSIRPRKATRNQPAESMDDYYDRLGEVIEENANHFFTRFKADYTLKDVNRFTKLFLNPVLENLLDDYEWWSFCWKKNISQYDYLTRQKTFPKHSRRHYRFPFGVWSPLMEARNTDIDHYLDTGDKTGLVRAESLFPEL